MTEIGRMPRNQSEGRSILRLKSSQMEARANQSFLTACPLERVRHTGWSPCPTGLSMGMWLPVFCLIVMSLFLSCAVLDEGIILPFALGLSLISDLESANEARECVVLQHPCLSWPASGWPRSSAGLHVPVLLGHLK